MIILRVGTWTFPVIVLVAACSTPAEKPAPPAPAAAPSVTKVTKASGLGTVAAGSPEDTLQACLARIPADATPGQRLLAEQTCRRDQAERR
jgi:hypothetical protein